MLGVAATTCARQSSIVLKSRAVPGLPLSSRRQQSGLALLAMLTLLTLWGLYLFVGQLSARQFQMERAQHAAAAMAEARDALIGRAATDDNRPGSLPCPAVDETGVSPLLVGNHCPSYIGRLPWKTLRVGDLRDDTGERFWYALAPALRDDDSAEPINSQTHPELKLDGMPSIAAIVFSPGLPLTDQKGRPSNVVTDYLDGGNSDGDGAYVSGPSSLTFNDKMLVVTGDDVFRVIKRRVLAEVRGAPGPPTHGLLRYYAENGFFPWADSDGDGKGNVGTTEGKLPYDDLLIDPDALTWLSANAWLPLVTYSRLTASSARIGIGDSKMEVIP